VFTDLKISLDPFSGKRGLGPPGKYPLLSHPVGGPAGIQEIYVMGNKVNIFLNLTRAA